MNLYLVIVRNESTGEQRTLCIESGFHADAQVTALHQLFHEEGWSRAVALSPSLISLPVLETLAS